MPNFIRCSLLRNGRPSRRRLFSRMHTTALSACARLRIRVKCGKQRWQVVDDIRDGDLDTVDECAAVETEPLEPVLVGPPARAFDDEPDGARDWTLRRMAQMRR